MQEKQISKYMKQIDARMNEIMFYRQENGILHNTFEWGYALYQNVCDNDEDGMSHLLEPLKNRSVGVMALNSMRSAKNAAISLITFIAQASIMDQKLDNEIAYSISDSSIQILEQVSKREDIIIVVFASMKKYAEEIAKTQIKSYQYLAKQAKDYIYQHLHDVISVEIIARELNVSSSYLSRQFKVATGITLKKYILKERVTRAKNLLIYSAYSIQDICSYMGFGSQSHFTEVFKSYTGETPNSYRRRYQTIEENKPKK